MDLGKLVSGSGGLQDLSVRAGAALVAGRTNEAIELCQQVLEWMNVLDDAPRSLGPLNHYRLSLIWGRVGDLEGAIVHGGEAFSTIDDTRNQSLRLKILDNLADLSIKIGHNRRAISILESAIALGAETGADWMDQTTRLCRIAETYLQTGLPQHASAALETCKELAERALGSDSPQIAYICLLHCRAQVEAGAWEQALRCGDHAKQLNPAGDALPEDCQAELESLLGSAHLGLRQFEEAQWHFEVALKKIRREPDASPEDVACALAKLAECRIEAGELDPAAEILSEAVDLIEAELLPEAEPYTDIVPLMRRASRRAEIWMICSRLAEAHQDSDMALETLERAKAAMYVAPVPNLRVAAELLKREARLYRDQGDAEAAETLESQVGQVAAIVAQVLSPHDLSDLHASEEVVEVAEQSVA